VTTVLESLNAGLHQVFSSDERVYLLGEDLLDPYGGAFKVTRGLSTAFPGRVLSSPISEAGLVGIAAGMALRGLRPVVEIMFGDFLTLAADQITNHAAKFRWMYNDQVRVPMVIRTPMGGRRGYGPTHSQTLEKYFLGVPGLRVVAPSALSSSSSIPALPGLPAASPGDLLYRAILTTEDPLLFIENKLLYLQSVQDESSLGEFTLDFHPDGEGCPPSPGFTLSVKGAPPPSLTIAAYGYMAELARQAVYQLAYEQEIFCELVIPTTLSPCSIQPVLDSLHRTRRLLVVEEGTLTLGWGAEILARTSEALGPALKACGRVAAREVPVPASGPLENQVLPGAADILSAAARLNRL
jgi:pyruvate/2-oxoglutarate/acetoin dehydrogenase E1 component